MKKLSQHLFDFARDETAGERLFFKLFEAMVVGLVVWTVWTWGFYILKIGDIVLPLGIARYIDISFMTRYNLSLFNAGLISLLLVAGFLRFWNYAYLGAFLLTHLQYAARYVLGEIPHSTNMLGMILLGLGLAMLAFKEPQYRHRFTLGFTYFFMGLGYSMAAVSKLVGTGFNWVDGHHLWLWLGEKGVDTLSKSGSLDYNWVQLLALDSYTLATAFLIFGLLAEASAFLMWWKPFRYPVMWVLLMLHIGIYMTMNIIFISSMYQLVFLGFPWAVGLDRLLKAEGPLLKGIESFSTRFV
jgi:hypothetical protein